jgi:hypothetical protein
MGALFGAPGLEVLTESSINRDIWAADIGGPINQLFRQLLESGLPDSSRHFPASSPGVIKLLWVDATQMVIRRSEPVLPLRLKGTATDDIKLPTPNCTMACRQAAPAVRPDQDPCDSAHAEGQ